MLLKALSTLLLTVANPECALDIFCFISFFLPASLDASSGSWLPVISDCDVATLTRTNARMNRTTRTTFIADRKRNLFNGIAAS